MVISEQTVAEIISLGRAGNTLRAIERATGVRRERVSAIFKNVGIPVRPARTANVAIVVADSAGHADARGDPPGAGQRTGDGGHRTGDGGFDWSMSSADGEGGHEEVELPDTVNAWVFPLALRLVHVRALRDHVAREHDLEDAARRMGIDSWVSREVQDLVALIVVASEIRDRLYGTEKQRRR